MEKLIQFGDTIVTMSIRNAHFQTRVDASPDEPDGFTSNKEDGMQFAFGITAYDSNTEIIEDPQYGNLKARLHAWGFGAQGEGGGGELETHPCTQEELGLSDDSENESLFYPIHENSKRDTEFY